jgi:hypothetical protein
MALLPFAAAVWQDTFPKIRTLTVAWQKAGRAG